MTLSQIVQFVYSFVCGLFYLYVRRGRQCKGEGSLLANVGLNATFLALFLRFYFAQFGTKGGRKKRA